METGTVTDTMAQMGVMGMVLEMVTVSLVVVVVVMAQGGMSEATYQKYINIMNKKPSL